MLFLFFRKDKEMSIFDEIKGQVSVREVMELEGIEFNRSHMCKCPFHDDKSPSMKVKPADAKYFCFGCGAKGDAIDFVANYYGLSVKDAAMKIANDFGIRTDGELRAPPIRKRLQKSESQIRKEAWNRTFRAVSDYRCVLEDWEKIYEPKEPGEEFHPKFVEAVKMREQVNYWLDALLYGEEFEQDALVHELEKEVEVFERKTNEHRGNQRKSYLDR